MKILYQGTAAAEAIPALFCQCPACMNARKVGGREIRTRAGALVDGRLKLDFGPDSYKQMLDGNLDYAKIHSILITHSHEDHFDYAEIALRRDIFAHYTTESPMMSVYGNAYVGSFLNTEAKGSNQRFVELKPCEPREIEGYIVTPLDAVHCVNGGGKNPVEYRGNTYYRQEQAFFYLIEKDGKRLLYAHDTSVFTNEAFEYLKGRRLDLVSLDCTNGILEKTYVGHMGMKDNYEVRDRLIALGAADENTIFVANHFSHNGYTDYEDMSARMPGFIIAYDGLEIEF